VDASLLLADVEQPEPLAAPEARLEPLDPRAAWHVVDQFFDAANALRADFERHFADPYSNVERLRVWDYWFVRDSYTYLRTGPQQVLDPARVQRFAQRLRSFALARLGLAGVMHPFLSLYVNGCGQTLHNDVGNGALGFVYSLTPWERRRFEGGETLLFRQRDYWRDGQFLRPGAGSAYYERIAPQFNRLLLFDNRLLHAVPELRGPMDPAEGRVVMHGHIHAGGPLLQGGAGAGALPALQALRSRWLERLGRFGTGHDGLLTLRCDVSPDGRLGPPVVLLDRVFDRGGSQVAWPGWAELRDELGAARLPPATAPGVLTLPLVMRDPTADGAGTGPSKD
jgi:hypothetical protein